VQIGAVLLCKGAKVGEKFRVAGGSPGLRVAGEVGAATYDLDQ